MEEEVRLLREEWAQRVWGVESERKDRIVYELFLLLEKMVTMLREHDNELRCVVQVPGVGEEWPQK